MSSVIINRRQTPRWIKISANVIRSVPRCLIIQSLGRELQETQDFPVDWICFRCFSHRDVFLLHSSVDFYVVFNISSVQYPFSDSLCNEAVLPWSFRPSWLTMISKLQRLHCCCCCCCSSSDSQSNLCSCVLIIVFQSDFKFNGINEGMLLVFLLPCKWLSA